MKHEAKIGKGKGEIFAIPTDPAKLPSESSTSIPNTTNLTAKIRNIE